MVYPLLAGLGVAAVAMTARAGLEAAKHIKHNPELMRQANAAAAGFRGMANAFPTLSQLMSAGKGGGFEATMTRREAAAILCIRETSSKKEIKDAHRKIMMMNHPDRGGSPFIASKINEASETLSGGRKSSTSAFS
jgi:DnaJ family protein C protein 19